MVYVAVPGGLSGPAGWLAVAGLLGLLCLLPAGIRRLTQSSGGFLCDRCKLNDARYCSRRERPNARRCPDFLGR